MTGCFHIVLAMKPVEAGFAENALKHGVAGLNIEEGRIAGGWTRKATPGVTPYGSDKMWHGRVEGVHSTTKDMDRGSEGRWPANLILGHSEKCVLKGTMKVNGITGTKSGSWWKGHQYSGGWKGAPQEELGDHIGYADADGNEQIENWECVEGCPVRILGEQSGGRKAGKWNRTAGMRPFNNDGKNTGHEEWKQVDDEGTAARYFKQVSELKVDE
jgi:hypothetical protein